MIRPCALPRSLTASLPLKKWWLEDDPFLLGWYIFRGEVLNLHGVYVIPIGFGSLCWNSNLEDWFIPLETNSKSPWKWGPLGKGNSYWKPPFLGAMLVSGRVHPWTFVRKRTPKIHPRIEKENPLKQTHQFFRVQPLLFFSPGCIITWYGMMAVQPVTRFFSGWFFVEGNTVVVFVMGEHHWQIDMI